MLRRSLAGAGALAGAYCTYKYSTDDGFARAVALYTKIGPVVAHYRLVELKQKVLGEHSSTETNEKEWRALDARYAAETVRTLENLQGMYTKYGQIAAGMNNTFSPLWVEELRKLEDAVPPQPVSVVERTIERETGRPLRETFASFDEVPLGSASIGQVHRATLHDGSDVAVKVQYPEAKDFFRSDMATIRGFMAIVEPQQLITLGELERQFEYEFDYVHEARNLREVGENMARHGFAPAEVVVPRPRAELCSERVLVMDLVPGVKLLDGLRRYGAVAAAREGRTLEEFEAEMRRKIEEEGVPSRYEGPSAAQISAYLRYMRLRDAVLNLGVASYNGLLGWAFGRAGYFETLDPPNAPRMMDVLMRVHGTQLLVDGVFNADTHAGNFLLMPDDRIALIDYGSTKRLTRGERLSACCMYAALRRRDEEMIYNLAVAGGYKSKHMRRDIIYKLIRFVNDTMAEITDYIVSRRGLPMTRRAHFSHRFGNDTMGHDLLGDKNVAQFMDYLKAEDPYDEVADNLIMAGFMSFRIRIVGLALNHPVVCSDWWGEIAERELERAGMPYESWTLESMRKLNDGTLSMAKAS